MVLEMYLLTLCQMKGAWIRKFRPCALHTHPIQVGEALVVITVQLELTKDIETQDHVIVLLSKL